MKFEYSRLYAVLLLFVVSLFCLPGCGEQPSEAGGGFTVVATTTMIADAARVIAGDDIEVVGLMRDGEDPHTYNVTPADAIAIADADLVLANGLHLESTLEKLIDEKAKASIYLAEHEGLDPIADEGAEGAPDPHGWMDVAIFRLYVEGICDSLVALDPENESSYRERASRYLLELDELDAWVREQFAQVPAQRRVIITSHDAFNYFGRAYGIEVHGIVGVSTEQQPTPRDIQRLESLIREQGVRAVFYETSAGQTLNHQVQQIAKATGIKVGGELYSDSLGEQGTEVGTYLGMMRHNTTTMVEALR